MTNTDTYIDYSSSTIYFTFSFILDDNNKGFSDLVTRLGSSWKRILDGKENPDYRRTGVTPLISIYHKDRLNKKKTMYSEFGIWKTIHSIRKTATIEYYLDKNFEGNVNRKKINYDKSKLELMEKVNVKISTTARIFYNGSGCITFEVQTLDKVDWRTNKIILSLSKRVTNQIGISKLNDDFLFDHFYKIINNEFIDKNIHLKCESITSYQNNPWEGYEEGLSPQNPNIFIVLLTNEEPGFWDLDFDENDNSNFIKNKNKELANILLNIVPHKINSVDNKIHIDHVRIPYGIRNENKLLKNISWDNKMFISTYRQFSILVYTNNEPSNTFIERSMLDAVELIYSSWYFSIIFSALLDEKIHKFRSETQNDNLEILKDILEMRKLFAYFMHNPINYRYVGGSIIDLVNESESDLRINELKDTIEKKFKLVDSLYDDQMEIIKLKTYRETFEDPKYQKNLEYAQEQLNKIRNK